MDARKDGLQHFSSCHAEALMPQSPLPAPSPLFPEFTLVLLHLPPLPLRFLGGTTWDDGP
eukprot:15469414-Alexandrium_andersonii.AAC.1